MGCVGVGSCRRKRNAFFCCCAPAVRPRVMALMQADGYSVKDEGNKIRRREERGEEGGKCSFVVVLQLGNDGLGFGLGGVKE